MCHYTTFQLSDFSQAFGNDFNLDVRYRAAWGSNTYIPMVDQKVGVPIFQQTPIQFGPLSSGSPLTCGVVLLN